MADSALIYLAPGAFQDALADARVLFQESRADSPRQGSLGAALEALSEQGAIERSALSKALEKYAIDPEKPNPVTV